jgi:hypothetical protein
MASADRAPDPAELAERAVRSVVGLAEVAVGLGILGVNRVQVLRRRLADRLADGLADSRADSGVEATRSDPDDADA